MTEQAVDLSKQHQRIAIIPMRVQISSKDYIPPYQHAEQEDMIAKRLQQDLYFFLMKQKAKGKFAPSLMDITSTQAVLNRHKLDTLTAVQLTQILQVDAVLFLNLSIERSHSSRVVAHMDSTLQKKVRIEEGTLNMRLFDAVSSQDIWTYRGLYSIGIGDSPVNAQSNTLYQAAKGLPYAKR